jgi:putative acetyltransferase
MRHSDTTTGIRAAAENDYPAIMKIWELSVRATHDFLPEDYLQEIKSLLPSILPQVPICLLCNEEGMIKGFAGVAEQKIEMLFLHPGSRGQGIGRKLTEYCIQELGAAKVDVNEQNEQAVGFYLKMGFRVMNRQELDSLGRPFPILEMQL